MEPPTVSEAFKVSNANDALTIADLLESHEEEEGRTIKIPINEIRLTAKIRAISASSLAIIKVILN
jgi:hypothetical protein